MTNNVSIDRDRLHTILECLDLALHHFDASAEPSDVASEAIRALILDDAALETVFQPLAVASVYTDTAHMLVKSARQSLDDALTVDTLSGRKAPPSPSLAELVARNSFTLKTPPGSPPIPRIPLVMPLVEDGGAAGGPNPRSPS